MVKGWERDEGRGVKKRWEGEGEVGGVARGVKERWGEDCTHVLTSWTVLGEWHSCSRSCLCSQTQPVLPDRYNIRHQYLTEQEGLLCKQPTQVSLTSFIMLLVLGQPALLRWTAAPYIDLRGMRTVASIPAWGYSYSGYC